jgi:hypothetical protein
MSLKNGGNKVESIGAPLLPNRENKRSHAMKTTMYVYACGENDPISNG